MKNIIKILSLFFISMSTSLGFSSFIENMENMENKGSPKKKRERFRNKTIKKRNKKVENFLNSMNSTESFIGGEVEEEVEKVGTDVEEKIGEPYVNPNYKPIDQNAGKANTKGNLTAPGYDQKELEGFGLLREGLEQQKKYHNNQQQYYNQNVPDYTGTPNNIPYYSQLANSQNLSGPKDDLMRKLNYVVHMLEEQQDEKTENVTEELVLYMFLGVFVIFVVDSFARAGKYTR
jgi:hypothetical protein